jgi:hypothetical protein
MQLERLLGLDEEADPPLDVGLTALHHLVTERRHVADVAPRRPEGEARVIQGTVVVAQPGVGSG